MLSSYVKIALRNLVRDRGYSFINIFGLSVGIACCLLIYLFVRHEWTYDSMHRNRDSIVRVLQHEKEMTRSAHTFGETPIPLGPLLAGTHPEVEGMARVIPSRLLVRSGAEAFTERVHLADPSLFSIFTFPLKVGDRRTALQDPSSVVLSASMARKYFGNEDAIGKTLSIQLGPTYQDFLVSAVAEDVPLNSSIRFEILISAEKMKGFFSDRALEAWGIIVVETFLQVAPGADRDELAAAMTKTALERYDQVFEPGLVQLILQPLEAIHFGIDVEGGGEPTSNPLYSYILASVAVLILLIACINFVILAVGRSTKRAKEVGMRKVLGAWQQQLRRQFLGEAFLLSALALILGIVLAELLLPTFADLAGISLTFSYDGITILFFAGLTVLISLAAGGYPAFVLSRFMPVETLKGQLRVGGNQLLRQGLVVLQFAISISLIAVTLTMLNQIRFMREKSLGFDKEQVVVITPAGNAEQRARAYELLRNRLLGSPEVAGITSSATQVGRQWAKAGYTATDKVYREFYGSTVDHDFIRTMALQIAEGRDFSREMTSDMKDAIIVNEALVRQYGWTNPIGQHLPGPNFPPHRVIGVVKDFNFHSLHSPVEPLVLALDRAPLAGGIENIDGGSIAGVNVISVRLRKGDLRSSIASLERIWKELSPGLPFRYSFLDEDIGQQYHQEERLTNIAGYSAGLAIVIACMGLFGLAAFTAEQRTKEIGIRKVLGASVSGIVTQLSKEFLGLVVLANIVALPAAYYCMELWLQDFSYRVSIGAGTLLFSASLALIIAWATVGYQAVRAAMANPVEALRYE